MPTLLQQRDLSNSQLSKAVIDTVITTDQFLRYLPMVPLDGTLSYTRAEAKFDPQNLVDTANIGHNSINKDDMRLERYYQELTTLIGDSNIPGRFQGQASAQADIAFQIQAKSMGIMRAWSDNLIHGNEGAGHETSDLMTPTLLSILSRTLTSDQYAKVNTEAKRNSDSLSFSITNRDIGTRDFSGAITTGAGSAHALTELGAKFFNLAELVLFGYTGFDGLNKLVKGSGNDFTGVAGLNSRIGVSDPYEFLARLDVFVNAIKDDGGCQFIMGNQRWVTRFHDANRRTSTGASPMDILNVGGKKMSVPLYQGIPVLVNDRIGNAGFSKGANTYATTRGGELNPSATATDDVFTGCFDDGSKTKGVCGLSGTNNAGISVKNIGEREDQDSEIIRVKWYAALVNFSQLGLAKGQM